MSFVRVAPPKAKFLNKSIIMLVAGGCALLLVLAFVSALQPPVQQAERYQITTRKINILPEANIAQLPNYTEAKEINELLNRHRPPVGRAPLWANWLEGQLQQMTGTQQQMMNQAQRLVLAN
ncbi:hypothetical protein [Piscirickettsia litoralis]|uniref:Uncharacterized protein n=1 Tax=Piscirickettsia litoralis TaxID=1891921 RepID=A0ABX3A5R0_9GAMM|nr:hypothetical protein [Piscirickettsia litoralis]ODN42775.1 hypothetical protein BGC07_07375 [Piscirickettsia litoralis]